MSNKIQKISIKKHTYISIFLIFAILLVLIEILDIRFSANEELHDIIYGIVTRAIGTLICAMMIIYCSYVNIFGLSGKGRVKAFLVLIPCWLVVINNFPFLLVLGGKATLNCGWQMIVLYALQCLLIGLFEESAFRGCLFMLILEGKHKTRKEVFLSIIFSSLIFGGIHIVNLFAGSGIVPVLQQLGYSFLIGSMCAMALLITKNLWTSIFLHATFNFAGGVIPTLGNGKIWDTPTIIITAALAVVVTVYMFIVFLKFDISSITELFPKKYKKLSE